MKRISLIFAILIFALRLPAQTNTPIRLALVSETDEASAAADVLTAELSSHKNLQLLERSEIEKVYREQSLSAGNKDYLKLGQILGADGLLLLDSVREGTNRFLMTRLVAAKPGVVIVDARSIWPAEAMSEWAAGFVDYLQPLFPKLTVLAKDAVPISVLNLRSALQTSGNQSIEKELTLLLIHRLTHQREVFVLERQHMGELAFEKELQQDESPFWTGRYLLDGVLDQDGFQNDRTKLNARLSSVKGGPLIQMEVTGSRTNLPAMVETLVGQILVALHRSSGTNEWRPLEEAEQYYQEAKWAFRWGLQREARAASESAWALGLQTKEVAMLRIRSYTDGIPTDFWSTSSELERLPPMPDGTLIGPAIRSLELLNESLPRSAANIPTNNADAEAQWLEVGCNALDRASGLLENYHRLVEARAGFEEPLARLRAQARQAAMQMPVNLTHRLTSYSQDRFATRWLALVFEWQELKWKWGGLWFEKPEDASELFRKVLEDGWRPSASLASRGLPRFAAWSWKDRQRIPSVEEQFLQALINSSNKGIRLEGLYLSVVRDSPAPVGHLDLRVQAWADVLWSQRQQLYEGKMNDTVLLSVAQVLQKKYGEDWKAPVTREPFASFRLRLRKDYLLTAAGFTNQGFQSLFPNVYWDNYTEEQARELLPPVQQFSKRLQLNKFQGALFAGESNRIASAAGGFPALTVSAAQVQGSGTNGFAVTDEPLVTVFVPLDLPWQSGAMVPLGKTIFRNGKLWFLAFRYNEYFTDGVRGGSEAYFISANPHGGGQEVIPVPEEAGSPFRTFEITDDSIYATAANRVLCYHFTDKHWETIEAPIPGGARIQGVNSQFFLTTGDSVLKFDPANRTVQVLASARRRPAINLLDQVDGLHGYDSPEVFRVGVNKVGVMVQNRLFVCATDTVEWREIKLPSAGNPEFYAARLIVGAERVILGLEGTWGQQLLEFLPDDNCDLLFEYFYPNGPVRRHGDPRWKWPAKAGITDSFILADSGSLWALSPGQWNRSGADYSRMPLLRFEPEYSEPMTLELQFKADGKPSNMNVSGGDRHLTLVAVHDGLVVVDQRRTGYWFIPQTKIAPKIKAQQSMLRVKVEADSSGAATTPTPDHSLLKTTP